MDTSLVKVEREKLRSGWHEHEHCRICRRGQKRAAPGLNAKGGSGGYEEPTSLYQRTCRMAGEEAAAGSSFGKSEDNSQAPSSFSQAQAKEEEKTTNQLQEAVGTVSSFGTNEQDFLDRIEATKTKHPELSVNDAINKSLHTAVSQKFGSGVGSATMKMGGGYSGEKFRDAVGMFQAKYDDLEMKGLSANQIKGSFTNVVASAKSDYKSHIAEAEENGVPPIKKFDDFIKEGLANIRVRGRMMMISIAISKTCHQKSVDNSDKILQDRTVTDIRRRT